MSDKSGQLCYAGEIRKYILGGNATFTLNYTRFQKEVRHTLRVKSFKKNRGANWSTGNADRSGFFITVLSGGDNETSYDWIGTMRQTPDGHYAVDSKIQFNHPQAKQILGRFKTFWDLLEQGCKIEPGVEFFHEGSCCVCGRKLTVPSSVASGIGPECEGKGM